MKNYFNSEERFEHIAILAMQEEAEKFSTCEALTATESEVLIRAVDLLKKFNSSVIRRFGEPYERKIFATMKSNNLKLVGKYEPFRDCVSDIVAEDLKKELNELRAFNCIDCKKKFKECPLYAACLTAEVKQEDNGECPYEVGGIENGND